MMDQHATSALLREQDVKDLISDLRGALRLSKKTGGMYSAFVIDDKLKTAVCRIEIQA